MTLQDGALLIAAERQRQVDVEGHTLAKDARYRGDELTRAAFCYLTEIWCTHADVNLCPAPTEWPWSPEEWKPSADPIRNLVRAGALICADLDRLTARPAAIPSPSSSDQVGGDGSSSPAGAR